MELKQAMAQVNVVELPDAGSQSLSPQQPEIYGHFPVLATRMGIDNPYFYILLNADCLPLLKAALALALEGANNRGNTVALRLNVFRNVCQIIKLAH